MVLNALHKLTHLIFVSTLLVVTIMILTSQVMKLRSKLSNLPKVTQLVSDTAKTQVQVEVASMLLVNMLELKNNLIFFALLHKKAR